MSNPFKTAASELRRSYLQHLKFTSAQWVFGPENRPVTERRFLADVQGVQHGYVCLVRRKPVDEVMVSVLSGRKISANELPDHGPYQDGDGWLQCVSIKLRSIETGDDLVFKSTSQGGRAAIADLLSKFGERFDLGKGGDAIIDLGVGSYQHARHGIVHTPLLHLVGWQDETAPLDNGDGKLGAELLDDEIPF